MTLYYSQFEVICDLVPYSFVVVYFIGYCAAVSKSVDVLGHRRRVLQLWLNSVPVISYLHILFD